VTRCAVGVEYEGSGFFGWQVQRQEPTIQGCLEKAISRVADHPVHLICCGRTDTGVHALCQVAHFDTLARRSERSWVLGVNSHLPRGISFLWLREVDDGFHARFSACARTYRYRILNRWVRPALCATQVTWCRHPLDAGLMHEAAQVLRGEHDFSAFRASSCQARHALREILDISVVRIDNEVRIDITANGFLYHMVRNIAGSLITIGRAEKPVEWLQQLLLSRNRTLAAATAPPEGLYFVGARYPVQYGLPGEMIDFPQGQES